ncbi:DUF3365 domain-containing protein [uncultured Nitrospira sp.]|uniref:Tll0287-like domain-containing protein n=1 Tax=uncultured Nitrospira sp. TaxID=157176 RepID=UPI0031408E8B
MKMLQVLFLTSAVILFGFNMADIAASEDGTHSINGIRPEIVADFIYAVIESDRTLYTTHIVDRMQETGTVIASEAWESRNALPLPAQMLLLSGSAVKEKGIGLEYRLASLLPIYQKNGPATDFEAAGLAAVEREPSQPSTGYITRGEQRYFQAIYADRAISKACVNCHNTHLLSPKRDRKLGDVMGGIIISFPVE